MTVGGSLPYPEAWRTSVIAQGVVVVGTCGFTVLGGLLAWQAVSSAVKGSVSATVIFVSLSLTVLSLVTLVAVGVRSRVVERPSAVFNRGGIEPISVFPMARGLNAMFVYLPASLIGFGSYGVLNLTDKLPWTDPGILRSHGTALVGFALAGLSAFVLFEYLRRGFQLVQVCLSKSGLLYRSTTLTYFVSWDDVEKVAAESLGTDRNRTPAIIVDFTNSARTRITKTSLIGSRGEIRRNGESSRFIIRPDGFQSGARPLLYAITFYFHRSDARNELGTDAALHRIRALELT